MADSAVGSFNAKKLQSLALQFREEEAGAALTATATAAANLGQQPKLSFKTFTVAAAQAAVSPDCSYRLLMGAMGGAKKSITAYVYNIGAPYILDLLKAKQAAGVAVRVMVDANDPNDKKSQEFENLKKLGIEVKLAPSSGDRRVFTVCHQKYVVVDGKTTVVESANWAQSSIPQIKQPGEYKPGNREWLLRVDDKDLAAWFLDLFDKDWNIPPSAGLAVAASGPVLSGELILAAALTPPATLFDIATASASVKLRPLISPVNYFEEVSAALAKASKRIYIQQQYITAGDGVNQLLEIVHSRAKTCDVRIIASPKFAAAWDKTVATLKAAGLLQALKAQNLAHVIHCHNKGLIIDDRQSVVSSTNWSENSIRRAREAGLLVTSKELTRYYASVFELDWQEGIAAKSVKSQTVPVSASEMN